MIHVPPAPWAHGVFEAMAWCSGAVLGVAVSRWRLREATSYLPASTGPGYFVALAVGAAPGAWLAGSLNTLNGARPALSHSIVGALVGAIVGVELYKYVK